MRNDMVVVGSHKKNEGSYVENGGNNTNRNKNNF
jgi:hypothetical protein